MHIERTHRTAWIGLGLIVLLALAAVLAISGGMVGRAPLYGYGARPFPGVVGPWLMGIGLIGLVIRLALWGGLIALIVSLFRRWSGQPTESNRWDSSSVEILKRRYAAGEISREQFEEMRRVLDTTAAPQV